MPVAAQRIAIFLGDQLADGVRPVAGHLRWPAPGDGDHAARDDQHPMIVAFEEFLHDDAPAPLARPRERGARRRLVAHVHGHALALVGVERLDGDRAADALHRRQRAFRGPHRLAARHR
jgi:hypothetical protein